VVLAQKRAAGGSLGLASVAVAVLLKTPCAAAAPHWSIAQEGDFVVLVYPLLLTSQTSLCRLLLLLLLPVAVQEGDFVVLVQEYAAGGNLFELLQKYGGRLNEHVTVQMVLEPFLRVLQVR
jgi:hypothetical protein